tara:strand:+ start:173 stop:748 length:576 start_codon:yes stop_codon:yes gene_type:complete
MAALDYRMALARGLIPPIKEAQQGILKSAGGDNVFKSEAWWNEQYDKTIDQGISETKTKTQYLRQGNIYMGGGNQWADVQTNSGYFSNSMPNAAMSGGYFNQKPQTRTVSYQEQRDLTQAELNSIVSDQKGQIAKTKREAGQEDNKTKRNRRGGGGLLSKAKPVEVKGLATAMPNLGVMSLYSSDSTLGVR